MAPRSRYSYGHDEFVSLLRAYNHQRHKSIAEQVREELIDANSRRRHRELCKRCKARSRLCGRTQWRKFRTIEGTGTRHTISDQKSEHVRHVKQVVFTDRQAYWPLSVRGVHYALLNYQFLRNVPQKLPYLNDAKSYGATSDLVTRMRLNGSVPWTAIDDGTRPLQEYRAFSNALEFVRAEKENLFAGYWRDKLQTQPCHVEVLCENNTIYPMAQRVTERYQVPACQLSLVQAAWTSLATTCTMRYEGQR